MGNGENGGWGEWGEWGMGRMGNGENERMGMKRTEYWCGRAHTDLVMIKNWTLTPPTPA